MPIFVFSIIKLPVSLNVLMIIQLNLIFPFLIYQSKNIILFCSELFLK